MPQPVELTGRPASPGLAEGEIVFIGEADPVDIDVGDPAAERSRLRAAIVTACEQITALMGAVDEQAEAILEFQVAMLEDEELSGPAFSEIEQGVAAARAWGDVLNTQIINYESAEDTYFRARAADLTDLRERVLRILAGAPAKQPQAGGILAGRDITPTRFLEIDWSAGGGIALSAGSPSSHVAMLARARGVPMVTGLAFSDLNGHATALVDGEAGTVVFSPGQKQTETFRTRLAELTAEEARHARFVAHPARTADGVAISVMINVADPAEVTVIDKATCDGIGLMRTEFLFSGHSGLPDEETQYRAYRDVLSWAGEKPVTIRTVDAGGDKPIPGLTVEESNPFLGLRGIRLSLSRPDIFRIQLRALARAAVHGNLKVMLPMVTVPEEIEQSAALLDQVMSELKREDAAAKRPPLGIMVEVPAVAIEPELFSQAAFFSIGSNDLTQYVTAAARDNASVAALNDPANPAVLRLIETVADFGARSGLEVSLCGDAGGDPRHIHALLGRGVRILSVAPSALGRTKAAIAEVKVGASDG